MIPSLIRIGNCNQFLGQTIRFNLGVRARHRLTIHKFILNKVLFVKFLVDIVDGHCGIIRTRYQGNVLTIQEETKRVIVV